MLIMVKINAQSPQSYSSSGTFVTPLGLSTIQVEAYGAGGGGGYGGTTNSYGGGGGGGGGYSKNTNVSVAGGTSYIITIGSGGSGGTTSTTSTANGTSGGNTTATFQSTTITANGGSGGKGYSNTPTGGNGGSGTIYTGGNGGTGTTLGSGGGGGSAGITSNGGNGSVPNAGAAGGGSIAGTGASGSTSSIFTGSTPSNYGGGGSGGTKNSSGGNGAGGYMLITFSCPTYSLSSTSATGPFCGTSTSTVTLSSSSLVSGTYTITYNLSGATTATGNTVSVNFVSGSPGTGTFTTPTLNIGSTIVTITNISSSYCSSTISSNNTTSVNVNPNLTTSLAISTSSTTVCATASVTFTATPTNGGTSPNYQWKLNGNNVGTNSNTYSTSTLANNDVVTCVLTSNASPCLVTSTTTSNALTMSVNPYVTTSVSIASTATTICSGANVTFTATPTNGGTSPSYQWNLNGSNLGVNSPTFSTNSLTDEDQVLCVLTSNATCVVGSPTTSNIITTSVNPTPNITSTTPNSITGSGTVSLGAVSDSGTISWFNVLTGGTALGTGTTFTTPTISSTTTYYAEAYDGTCYSTPRTSVVATVSAPDINIQGNSVVIANNDVTPIAADWTDFTAASTRTFTINNTGSGILNIGAITFSGTNASEFSVVLAPSSSVASGASTTFTVQFTPLASGTRTATISIVTNVSGKNPYKFVIQGTGSTQVMNVQGNNTDIADGATTSSVSNWTDFSNVSSTRTFTIQNTGSITLTIGAISFSGTNPSDFSVISSPSSTVAGRSSTTFTVKFTPGATGARSARISIVNNDPATSKNPYDFLLTGNTSSVNMNVKAGSSLIASGSTTYSTSNWTDFGTTNVSSPITRSYTIENTGTSNLNLTGTTKVVLTGSSDFSVTTQPSSPVTASSTTTFTVTFNPSSIGNKTASISIANNDSGTGKNPYTFNIRGNGIQSFVDTDGDGIYNNVDLDDDNDGIPDNIEQNYASGSVLGNQVTVTLLNETFGAGTTRGRIYDNVPSASTTYCWEDGTSAQAADECDTNPDLNDGEYTVYNSAQIASWASSYWYMGKDHTGDTNGKMGLFNATNNLTEEFYRTTIQGVIANAPMTYSFWVLNLDRSDAPGIDSRNRPNITVEIRDLSNNVVTTINTGDIAPTVAGNLSGNWYQFSSTFTPTKTGYSIVFRNNQIGGLGNDLALDDIKITQKLTDTDQDGIADVYDLDSDNDGIGDIVEDEWTALANGKDRMDLGATWIDANGNGWHDTAEAYYNGGGTAKNFDGDSVPNYIDLDSDNDSKFDVDEMGLLNGDGDVNGDGEGDGADSDGDGILNVFDNFSGFGNTGKSVPTNTLSASKPDYLNVTSLINGVYDISSTLYSNLDGNNDGKIDGSTDSDKDGILDNFDTNTSFYGSPRNLNRKLYLDFDGRNDYGQENIQILDNLSTATMMAWIDLNSTFSTDGVIIGQNKFHLRINSSKKLEAVVNSTTLTYNATALNTSQWYHVGVVYDGSLLKLYLNGLMVASTAASGTIASDGSKFTIGRDPLTSTKFFKGKMDEVRVFNTALTDTQFQRMVYQEIQNSSSQIRGTIIPINIGSLPFSNLLRYYKMDAYKNDIIDDQTTAAIDVTGMKIYNHKNIYVQQAPLPFVTIRSGSFATAVDNPSYDIRGLDIMDQDWSIVQVKNNITETANNIDIGMIVNPGVVITMSNDNKIQNDWYLLLHGKIVLQGASQLIQSTNNVLDVTSAGSIERGQKGQSSIYNYNYWSSPVSTINTTSNNSSFTINGVLRDGTTPTNIQNITWTSGINGSPTTPITLSSYWLYKFQNLSNSYANWSYVGPNGSLLPAQGFTLKGSGAATATQNYVFTGKPNNGTITTVVSPGNLNLTGNPYPSALDSNAFINANSSIITGSLYFWQHYSTNTSHVTGQYQGGYGVLNLVGGTPPVAPLGISGLGSSSKTAGRFIPPGQAFFITGSATGGTVTFNNNQRLFIKEDDNSSFTMFKHNNSVSPIIDRAFDNREDTYTEVEYAKLRVGYTFGSNNYHRQILLGFMNNLATSGIDPGYDAIQIDNNASDMYFINGTTKLNIQGDGYFNPANIYPLGAKNEVDSMVTFSLDEKDHFDDNQSVFIYDNVTDIYHDITTNSVEINLPAGTYEDRFSLRFINNTALSTNDNIASTKGISINYSSANSILNIKNTTDDSTIRYALLYNLVGQLIATIKIEAQDQLNIQIPVSNYATSVYIVKVVTDRGEVSKKFLLK